MLFAPFGCTHPPPPVPPFLFTQNLSPKDIAGSEIKVSSQIYPLSTKKSLMANNFKMELFNDIHEGSGGC